MEKKLPFGIGFYSAPHNQDVASSTPDVERKLSSLVTNGLNKAARQMGRIDNTDNENCIMAHMEDYSGTVAVDIQNEKSDPVFVFINNSGSAIKQRTETEKGSVDKELDECPPRLQSLLQEQTGGKIEQPILYISVPKSSIEDYNSYGVSKQLSQFVQQDSGETSDPEIKRAIEKKKALELASRGNYIGYYDEDVNRRNDELYPINTNKKYSYSLTKKPVDPKALPKEVQTYSNIGLFFSDKIIQNNIAGRENARLGRMWRDLRKEGADITGASLRKGWEQAVTDIKNDKFRL